MRKIILSEFITVDGLMADPGNTMDWVANLFNDEMQRELYQQRSRIDTILLGRITYELLLQMRPNKNTGVAEQANLSAFINNTPKIVFSGTLSELEWNNASLQKVIDATTILQWKKQPGKDMAIIGSASIAQAFINLGLVDEYRLLVHPVMLAKGKALFKNISARHSLKPMKTETYKNGVVSLYYEAAGRQ